MRATTKVALLRGINVGGHHRVAMSALRDVASSLGWQDVRTCIQSGNLVFRSAGTRPSLEAALEQAMEEAFGFGIPVISRTSADWQRYIDDNPLLDAARTEARLVMLALSKLPPAPNAVAALQDRAAPGEHVVQLGDALWIHFGSGVSKTRLSPALLDRCVGSPVTMRNWRTVLALGETMRHA